MLGRASPGARSSRAMLRSRRQELRRSAERRAVFRRPPCRRLRATRRLGILFPRRLCVGDGRASLCTAQDRSLGGQGSGNGRGWGSRECRGLIRVSVGRRLRGMGTVSAVPQRGLRASSPPVRPRRADLVGAMREVSMPRSATLFLKVLRWIPRERAARHRLPPLDRMDSMMNCRSNSRRAWARGMPRRTSSSTILVSPSLRFVLSTAKPRQGGEG